MYAEPQNPLLIKPPRIQQTGYLIVLYFNAWILLFFIATNLSMVHWFVLPTFLCGVMIGRDGYLWLKGDYDLFDPKGLLGALGWHFFFLAPILFIYWEVGMKYVNNPPDWRPWVGYLSILNAAALLLYKRFHDLGFKQTSTRSQVFWKINANRAFPLCLIFLGIAFLAQFYYFARTGGISGIITLTAIRRQTGVSQVSGVGVFEIIGNAIPILLMVLMTLRKDATQIRRSSPIITVVVLICLGILQFILGGLKGSRSSTVWSLFWIFGIVHFYWRPINRHFAWITLAVLLSFMYLYGFYKGNSRVNGLDAFMRLAEGESFSQLERATGRSFEEMMVSDLARVDTQSFQIYRLSSYGGYQLRWGKTYLSSLLSYIPGWIWKERPPEPEKTAAGTELFYGTGSYVPGDRFQNSQKVYGLAGEALLNFGILSFPLPFSLWGFLVGRYRRSMFGWASGDLRWFLAPFLTLLLMIALISDFYNLLGFFISKGLFPLALFFLALILSGQKIPVA